MPATIVPINLTRSFSVKNPTGIRYGNFEGVVHLPPISKDNKIGLQDFSQINNQQIYRTICDWFEYWRPWQQKTFLYGVVDRCSTRQLDILATTLEPVRHRDYAAAYKMRYPSSSVKTTSARIQEHEKQMLNTIAEGSGETNTDKYDESSDYTTSMSYEREGSFRPQRMDLAAFKQEGGRMDLFNEISENDTTTNDDLSDKNGSVKGRESGIINDQLALIEEKVVFSDKSKLSPVDKFADSLASDVLQNALEEVSILQKYMNKEDTFYLTPVPEEKSVKEEKQLEKETTQDSFRVFHSSQLDRSFIPPPNSASKGLPVKSAAHPVTPGFGDVIPRQGSHLTRSMSGISKKSASQLRYELYGQRTTLSTPDFFSSNGLVREGSMQREIRYGQVNKPNRLKDIPIPLQRSFKGVKWWPGEPHEGKVFLRANKKDLISNFKDQLQKIWNWLELWEDYEKINLLKEILKITNPEVLSALFHYIQQKLRDTRDINRLSDKLLLYIFSFLEPSDITSCSQVCRRWRFLCATDSLWMIKCHELGLEEGISNMEDIVLRANTRKMGIDWRLAYEELKKITEMMKWDAKKKAQAAAEEVERLKKLKEAEEEIDIDIVSEKSFRFRLKSVDILAQYQRLYHYDVYTPPSVSSEGPERVSTAEVDIHVQRGTQSAFEREEAQRKAKEEEKKKEKQKLKLKFTVDSDDEDKESDIISLVSSEDFTNEKDFVFQEKEDEENFYRMKSTLKWKRLKSNLGDEKPKELEKIRRDHQTELRSLAKQQDKERFKLRRSATDVSNVKSMVKRKPQPKKNKDEIAFDVRTDLIQAQDILGKSVPNLQLEWKNQEEEKTEARIAIERYMGVVKSVRRVRKLQGHMNGVVSIHFDKKRLISAGLDRTIRLWDIRSGKSIHKFYGHKGGIRCLQFEGNTLLTGSWDTTIMVWDLRAFERKAILSQHRDCVSCLQMNHQFIVSGSYDKTVRVWYRLTYIQAKVLKGHKAGVNCLSFDGTFVVSGSSDMTLRLVNIHTEECLHVFENGQDQVLSVLLQGDLIISSDMSGHVYFWNKETGNSEAAIEAHDAPINKLAFYRGRFFTAAGDNTIREWDLLTMTSVRVLQGHSGPVRDVKVANDRIVTCSDDGTVRIWDLYDSHAKTVRSRKSLLRH